jgi:hypothetical protein
MYGALKNPEWEEAADPAAAANGGRGTEYPLNPSWRRASRVLEVLATGKGSAAFPMQSVVARD